MTRTAYLLVLGFLVALGGPALSAEPDKEKLRLGAEFDSLLSLYKHLHTHPELSLQEEKTSAQLAKELRESGFEVTEKVGGFGVVGVLKNGPGPTVLVRTDMDALPVTEASCPTRARSAPATRPATRSASCTPAATT
jgi:hippurate hydrolase